ncbi:MAG: aminotransferase class I/II-fold pyridoxal phosphate-dependent enzyme [Clostridia bacterium]|nr:aminotransferase class I/II-fold pyridoxal phosphate-dependent enzyme [Clostridia bacterium]
MIKKLQQMTQQELKAFYEAALKEYENCKAKGLKLDMSRGKPARAQTSLSDDMFDIDVREYFLSDGMDAGNYGGLDGLPSCKRYFAELLGVQPEEVFAAGNASLSLMYDTISKAYTHGLLRSPEPWSKLDKVKWLCPAPGYDRHFKICQSFGMELITVPMTEQGPDMDMVEELVKDPAVKGIWCVPKFSNPDGIVYSDEVIHRMAALKPAAPDFVIMWDNAYCVHEFEGEFAPFRDIISLCREAGRPDMVFEFASTSKITYPGGGIACFASSKENTDYMRSLMSIQTIGFDKINQLRHVLYLKDKQHTIDHMKKHAEFMRPKFEMVEEWLSREIAPLGIGRWHKPQGGYFVSFFTLPGCAKRTNQLAGEAGVVMTGAGATYPYGKDPEDSNLRIAPSYPPLEELEEAMAVFCACVKLAAAEKLLNK